MWNEVFMFILGAVFAALGVAASVDKPKQETIIVEKVIIKQDDRAVNLLSQIMGQDCTDITIFETTVTATAYTAVAEECDSTPEVTANMTPSRIGLLALSRDLLQSIPLGSRVIIPELGVFVACDKMNKRFKTSIDILHANKKAAKLFGKKKVTLIWLR